MKKSQKFFYSCLFFLIGLSGFEWFDILKFKFILVFVLLSLILGYFFLKTKRIFLIFIMFFLIGNVYASLLEPKMNENNIAFYNESKMQFEALIIDEPDVRLDHQKLTVKPKNFKGKVLLKVDLYPEYDYGDRLSVNCKLQKPEPIENFKYDKYLAKSGIYSVCYQPFISVIEKNKGSKIFSQILNFKKLVIANINKGVSEPQASLTAGILIGARQGIPSDLLIKFNATGVTHIIAISGFNITIVVIVLLNLAKSFGINRKKSIWAIIICLVLFVILAGMSASVVRSAIMGIVVILAKHLGRMAKPKNILILSALLMSLFNPKILIWDAGFQLSFLATVGLIYFSPILKKYFTWVTTKFSLQENLVCTLSAMIFTLPLILFNFQRLSIVSVFVNLLILPAIPIAMFIGFWQIIFSFVNIYLGQFIGWFNWLVLGYVVKVVEIFASLPWASVEMRISWPVMILIYMILLFIIIKNQKIKSPTI